MHGADISIPAFLAKRPKDKRGYPIPFSALVDRDGKAHFTVSDPERIYQCLKNDLCGLCGIELFRFRWFVGGPMSAFDSGLFSDPPMHKECAEYALRVCPYIATPNYSKRIDGATVRDGGLTIIKDEAVVDDRPKLFVAVMGVGTDVHHLVHSAPKRKRITDIQFWRHGMRLSDAEGARIAGEEYARQKGFEPAGEAFLAKEKDRAVTLVVPRS